jgi:hypothetical protein
MKDQYWTREEREKLIKHSVQVDGHIAYCVSQVEARRILATVEALETELAVDHNARTHHREEPLPGCRVCALLAALEGKP